MQKSKTLSETTFKTSSFSETQTPIPHIPSDPSGVDVKHAKHQTIHSPTRLHWQPNYSPNSSTYTLVERPRIYITKRNIRLSAGHTLDAVSMENTNNKSRTCFDLRKILSSPRRSECTTNSQYTSTRTDMAKIGGGNRLGTSYRLQRHGRRRSSGSTTSNPDMGNRIRSDVTRRTYSISGDDNEMGNQSSDTEFRRIQCTGMANEPSTRSFCFEGICNRSRNKVEIDHGFSTAKRVYPYREIQDDNFTNDYSDFTKERLRLENRHRGSIYTYCLGRADSPTLHGSHSRSPLSTDGYGLWNFFCPTNIYKDHGDSADCTSKKRDNGFGIPGRSFRIRSAPITSLLGSMPNSTIIATTGFSHQLGEVHTGTEPGNRRRWLEDRFTTIQHQPSSGKEGEICPTNQELFEQANCHIKGNLIHPRHDSTHGNRSALCSSSSSFTLSAPYTDAPPHTIVSNASKNSSADLPGFDGTCHEYSPLGRQDADRPAIFSPSPRRQLGLRMGREPFQHNESSLPYGRFLLPSPLPDVSRYSDSQTTSSNSHTNFDNVGSISHFSARDVSPTVYSERSSCTSTVAESVSGEADVRQHVDSRVHQSGRSFSESILSTGNTASSHLGTISRIKSPGRMAAGRTEHIGRFRLSTPTSQPRNYAESDSVSSNRQHLGSAFNRPLCFRSQCSSSKPPILLMDVRSGGDDDRCMDNDMDVREQLDKPTLDFDPKHPLQNTTRTCGSNNNRPRLANTALVSPTSQQSDSATDRDPPLPKHVPSAVTSGATRTTSVLATNSRLESFRRSGALLGFSDEVTAAAVAGWANPAKYRQVDKDFRCWLRERGLDTMEFSSYFPLALRYLVYLKQQRTPYSKIRSVKTALAGLLGEDREFGHRTLGKIAMTKQLMKAFRDDHIDHPKYDWFWDPKIISDYLLTQPPIERWTLPFLTKVLAYLYKAGLAARSSDLVRANAATLRESTDPSKYYTIDVIAPKEARISSNPNVIRKRRLYRDYSAEDRRLDWVAVRNQYENHPNIKKHRPNHPTSLLLTFGGTVPGKPPTTDTVTRWVAEILWRAGLPTEFSPHSVRGAIVTHKLKHKLETELQGIWSSETTRKKWYDRSDENVFTREAAQQMRLSRIKERFVFRKKDVPKEATQFPPAEESESSDDESENERSTKRL